MADEVNAAPVAAPVETAPVAKETTATAAAAPAARKTILILGASYGGLSCAHYILKHIIPTLADKDSYNVTLVGESSKFYARVAAPRAIVSHKLLPLEKVFYNVESGFKSYPADSFTFVQGTATAMDQNAKTVTITLADTKDTQTITYHALILATGTRTTSPLFGLHGDHIATENGQKAFQDALPSAKTIVIAGGGPCGVETAGELGELLNGKPSLFGGAATKKVDITLYTSDAKLLPKVRESIGKACEHALAKVGVTVVYNTRVESVEPPNAGLDDNVAGNAVLRLSTGETKEADLYINATGVTPNTQFVPTALLNERGYVNANPVTTRVDAAGPLVYAVGDVSSYQKWHMMDLYNAVPVLATNLKRDLNDGKEPGKDREFKAIGKETMLVPIGKGQGVGTVFGFKAPSFMVKMVKGKHYFTDKVGAIVDGSHWNKAS